MSCTRLGSLENRGNGRVARSYGSGPPWQVGAELRAGYRHSESTLSIFPFLYLFSLWVDISQSVEIFPLFSAGIAFKSPLLSEALRLTVPVKDQVTMSAD